MSVIGSVNRNIIYPILIHLTANFTLDFLHTGDRLEIFLPTAAFHAVCTAFVCLVRSRKLSGIRNPGY